MSDSTTTTHTTGVFRKRYPEIQSLKHQLAWLVEREQQNECRINRGWGLAADPPNVRQWIYRKRKKAQFAVAYHATDPLILFR